MMGKLACLASSSVAIVGILGIAIFLRGFKIAEWSLWEDEETSIYFSQHPGKPFPSYFPLFFYGLRWLFRITGISPAAGRLLPAAIGVLSIWLLYVCFRKLVGRQAALLAALLVAVNLGHLFWSQSIRYYTMAFVFQLLCMYWFLAGLERGRYGELLLSNVAFALALLSHFSAVLLAPVLVAYLAWAIAHREAQGGYGLRGYLTFAVPFAILMGMFAWRFLHFQQLKLTGGSGVSAEPQDLVSIVIRVAAYFGVPVLALSLLVLFQKGAFSNRTIMFFLVAGFLPLAELAVIACLNLAIVTWYYAFFALAALAILASISLMSLYQRGRQALALALGGISVLYYAGFLVGYYTTMHGDRPRWEEASAYLRQAADVKIDHKTNARISASVPGVVAYYLGVDPAETMTDRLVHNMPAQPPKGKPDSRAWYVVEASLVSDEWHAWFTKHCHLKRRFEARSGPKDRSVLVYSCRKTSADFSPNALQDR